MHINWKLERPVKKKPQWLEGHERQSGNILVNSIYPNKFCCIDCNRLIYRKEGIAALPLEPQLTAVYMCLEDKTDSANRPVTTDNAAFVMHLNSDFEAEVKE